MKGLAHRGNQLAFGSFGIKSLESKWITGRQIEAARVAVTRYMQRQGHAGTGGQGLHPPHLPGQANHKEASRGAYG